MSTNYLQMVQKMTKLPIYYDTETLDIYCEYLLNDGNKLINFSNLTNLKDLMDSVDPKVLMSSDAKMARYEFIRLYLEARIERGIIRRKLCINYVDDNIEPRYRKTMRRDILNSIDEDELSKNDIVFINDMIYSQLNVNFMHRYKVGLTKLIDDLNNGDYGKNPEDCNETMVFIQTLLSDLTKAQRRSKQDNRFNLTDVNHFKSVMAEACERLLSDAQYWKTGMQGLNNMLNGGLEDARCYNFIGATGGFKSGLLLNIMKGVKLYNKGHAHKDPNKRPTILFLSQENNIWETISRIFGIFGNGTSIRNYTPEQIMSILKKGGFGIVDDENDIDIEFRYYGNMDIGVPDIKGIIEELDSTGREVVVVIQDYIERLRPPMLNVDRRIQLNDVSNQMHDIAIELDIPFVTASQFNRSGAETIETMRAADKLDIGKNVGMKDISESYGMLKNFDANIGIVVEYDKKEERFYLSFRALKYRGDDSQSITYFLQPFVGKNSKIQLQDDINEDIPVYRTTLADGMYADIMDENAKISDLSSTKRRGIMVPNDILDAESIEMFNHQLHKDHTRANDNLNSVKSYSLMFRDDNGFYHFTPRGVSPMLDGVEKSKTYKKRFVDNADKLTASYSKYMKFSESSDNIGGDSIDVEQALSKRKKGKVAV